MSAARDDSRFNAFAAEGGKPLHVEDAQRHVRSL
jgi:hypothetical protein